MKKRNGFVSNSSSSSFIAIGNIKKVDGKLDYEKLGKEGIELIGEEDGFNANEYLEGTFQDFEEGDYIEMEITQDMVGKKIIISTRAS